MIDQISSQRLRSVLQCVAPLLLVILGVAVYANSLQGSFFFDDHTAIVTNDHIRRLWPPTWVSAPVQTSVTGRPVVGLTLALNHALGGLDARGYHALNIAVHVLCALVLYGVVRRTLAGPALGDRFGRHATGLAFAGALIWMVHPLQTECVDYTIQRTESIMALFYLLTLYCAIRGAVSPRRVWWYGASVTACALGMLSKESMVTAPVMVVLYDWAFRSGPYGPVLRKRGGLYAGLAATWVILAAVMLTGPRSDSVGFSLGVSAGQYALNQCVVIVHYLRLALWPHPLVIDYGFPRMLTVGDAALSAALLAVLLAATAVALLRWPPVGFLGAWLFVILAPTSSVVPIAPEVGADRRMYLPLAGLVVLVVVAGYQVLRSLVNRKGRAPGEVDRGRASFAGAALVAALALPLAWATIRRNTDYRDRIAMWRSAAEIVPHNWRAYDNLAAALVDAGRRDEAIEQLRELLREMPRTHRARLRLGNLLAARGSFAEAISQLQRVVVARPDRPESNLALAAALDEAGRTDEAIPYYRRAAELEPESAEVHRTLARALQADGRTEEAEGHFRRAAELDPGSFQAQLDRAGALGEQGDVEAAVEIYQQLLEVRPDDADVHYNLAVLLGQLGRVDEAIMHLQASLERRPDDPETLFALAIALRTSGRIDEAITNFEHTLRVAPDHAGAHRNLAMIEQSRGRIDEAIEHYRRALAAEPESPGVLLYLGLALRARGELDEAIGHMRQALQLNPRFAQAHQGLAVTLVMTGRKDEALEHFAEAMRDAPEWPVPLNSMAWILATDADPTVRRPDQAIQLAERAARMTGWREPQILDTLAAAYAAGGQFDNAVETARQALDMASAAQNAALTDQIRSRLGLYEQGRPYRSPAPVR